MTSKCNSCKWNRDKFCVCTSNIKDCIDWDYEFWEPKEESNENERNENEK